MATLTESAPPSDEQMAEAVIDGLADIEMRCTDCGAEHYAVAYKRDRIYCDCGVVFRRFKHKGWTVSKRTLSAWRKRERAAARENRTTGNRTEG